MNKETYLENLLYENMGDTFSPAVTKKLVDKKMELYRKRGSTPVSAPAGISGDGSSLVGIAAAEVGTSGGANGANKYNGYRAQPWCGDFVNYVAGRAGVNLPSQTSVYQGLTAMESLGRYKSRDSGYTPRPGDLVYFNWRDGGNIYDHVGIVEAFDGKTLYTIEGNTNGGMVARRNRSLDNVMGYGIIN